MRLDKGTVDVEIDYDKIIQHPQATRYVAESMLQTGLLQQFRYVELEEDDEPTGLAAMELGVEDDGYQPLTIDEAGERETQQKSTNMPDEATGQQEQHYQLILRRGRMQK
jgi:hypothetical protein